MLKKVVITIIGIIAAVLIYVATLPDTFRIERSTRIKASPERVFALINDFHEWEAWSPWEKVDPAVKRTYSGSKSGKGAIYEWSGNNDVGSGRMEIVGSSPPSTIVIKIDFITPIEGHNTIEFLFSTEGDSTTLTQSMYGPNTYFSKLMGLIFNMEKMIGPKFEEGLTGIKTIAEK